MRTTNIALNVSNNLHICVSKQNERNQIDSKMAEFLAKGGVIKSASNSNSKISYFCNENKDVLGDKAQRVLNSINAGRTTILRIAQAVNIPVEDMIGIVNFLISKNLIEKIRKGKSEKLVVKS